MAIKATGQITIVDLSDSRQLSVYLTANLPKTQILDLSTGTASPDWAQENLEITPNILLNQVAIPLTDKNLTVTYKRKDGSGAESSLVAGETVTNKVLKVNANVLNNSDAKSITYLCYVSYLDTKLEMTVKAQADINFSLVTSGTQGIGISEIKEYYYNSDSATELTGGEWVDTYPGWEKDKYTWTKSIITYTNNTTSETDAICVSGTDGKDGTNGKDGEDGKDGTNGSDGRGIVSTTIEYQSSTSGTETPTGTWEPSVPEVTAGNYLWTRTTINYTDNTDSVSYSVSYVAKDGKDGENGSSGSDGIGISKTNIAYQKSTNGQTVPTGTWVTSIPPVDAGEYLWTRTEFIYTDNSKKYAYSVGQMGKTGQTGETGVGITSIDVYYYLSTSPTELTGGSWVTTAPEWVNGSYMWSKTVTTYTKGEPTETDPVCITGAKGEDAEPVITFLPAQGENLTLEQSGGNGFKKIHIYGDTQQATRSGKNLLNVFDENWRAYNSVKQSDGSLKASISNTYYAVLQNWTAEWANYLMQNKGKTLTFSQKELIENHGMGIVIFGQRTSTTLGYQAVETQNSGLTSSNSISITIADDFTSIEHIELRTIRRYPIAQFTDTTTIVSELQLEEGAIATEYEPYGAMPSPDYPSEIKNVEGKNLFDINKPFNKYPNTSEIAIRIINNVLNLKAEGTTGAQIGMSHSIILKKNSTYTLSCKAKKINGTNPLQVVVYPFKNGVRQSSITIIQQIVSNNDIYNLQKSFTINDDYDYIQLYFYNYANTPVPIGEETEYWDIQLEEGTVATEYAPYNSLAVKVTGKNIIPFPYFDGSIKEQNGITYTVNDDGSMVVNGTATANTRFVFYNGAGIQTKKGTVLFSGITGGTTTTYYLQFYINGNWQPSVQEGFKSFEIKENEKITTIDFSVKKGVTLNNLIVKPQLEFATETTQVATPYEPYKEQIVYFPLAEGQKLYEGSYLADDGIHHNRAQLILDGTENIADYGNNLAYYINNINPKGLTYENHQSGNGICSHLSWLPNGEDKDNSVRFQYQNGARLYLMRRDTNLTQIKAWLSEEYANGTPVIIEYETEYEIIVPYTEKQQQAYHDIKTKSTFYGLNHINCIGTLPIYLDTEYWTWFKGESGIDIQAVKINPSTQFFKSTSGTNGIFNPEYIYLYPSFQNVDYSKWQYSTDGITWTDVVSGSNGLTIATYNSVDNSLRIQNTSDLFTNTITSINFRCVSSANAIYDSCTITKLYDANSEIIVGTQTAATNVWTGIASFAKLVDGQQIVYWLPYAGTSSSATLELTLADGTTTGAKNLYYQGTTRMTTHYPAGSVIHLTYRENVSIAGSTTKYTGWWGDANYTGSDTYDRIRYNSAITAVTAISSGRIITGTASGFKHIAANTAFDINKPILYAGSAIAAAATGSNNYIAYSNLNLANTKSGFTGTKGKTVYIVGTLNGTTFTPNSTLFTTTEPTKVDGLVYIALGVMSSTTNSTLFPEHPLYKFVNGKFQSLSQVAFEAQDNLDNLEIGERNFILNTDRILENTATSYGQAISMQPYSQVSDDMIASIKKGDKLDYSIEIKVDGDLTFGTTNPWIGLEVAYKYKKDDGTETNAYHSIKPVREELNDETKYPKGKWIRIHSICTIWNEPIKWHQPCWLIRDTLGQISTRRPQVCKANIETDWSPAPEDTDTKIDNINIGGRNFWKNSTFNLNLNNYQIVENEGTISLDFEKFRNNNVLKLERDDVGNASEVYTVFKEVSGKDVLVTDSAEAKLVDIEVKGETTLNTSTASANIFDEEYYNDDSIYTSGTYKYVKARFAGNRVLWFKATLKEGKTAQTGAYIAISESAGSPYESGTKSAYAISNGAAAQVSVDLTGINDIYVNIYPNTLTCATIFDNYNVWVSTDNVSYTKFIPEIPSPYYPGIIANSDDENLFNESEIFGGSGFSIDEDGFYVCDFKTLHTKYGSATDGLPIKFIEGVRYAVSFEAKINVESPAGRGGFFRFMYTDGTYNDINISNNSNINKSVCYRGMSNTGKTIDKLILSYGSYTNCSIKNVIVSKGPGYKNYVPYNSVSVEVSGKNQFDIKRTVFSAPNTTLMGDIENGYWYKGAASDTTIVNAYSKGQIDIGGCILKANTKYTISFDAVIITSGEFSNVLGIGHRFGGTDKGNLGNITISSTKARYNLSISNKTSDYTIYFALNSNEVQITNICITVDETTEYIPYNEQIVYFPLEGQKLMEGSYLADDGIHHVRKQKIFTGTENYGESNWADCYVFRCSDKLADSKRFSNSTQNVLCISSHYTTTHYDGGDGSIWNKRADNNYPNLMAIVDKISSSACGMIYIKTEGITTAAELKQFISEQYANGTPVTMEYELNKEEVISYTDAQKTAWNKIKQLYTQKGGAKLISNANTTITYSVDNGGCLVFGEQITSPTLPKPMLLSAWVYVDSAKTFNGADIYITDETQNYVHTLKVPDTIVKNQWTRLSIAIEPNPNQTFTIAAVKLKNSGSIKVSSIKLEDGNKLTDWTPAPEDNDTVINNTITEETDALKNYIEEQNKAISNSVDEKIKGYDTEIRNEYDVKFNNVATKTEVDAATGKIRDLEEYTSQLKVDGDALRFNVAKTKGVNLIKNSVMLQYKTNTNGQISANFWLNKNLKEESFTNVTCNDIDSVRAKTTSGSAIVFDYSTDATGLTYDYILSSPIDFKINSSNIMCSYKIKGAITAGTFFAGLVFYKRDTTESGLGATTAFSQASGIPTAHYLALNEYTTTENFADFTEDYVLRTTPFVRQNKQTVTWSCPVSETNTITLPYAPYLVNGSCTVIIYNMDGSTTAVTTTGTTVSLGEGDWPKAVTVSYDRLIANFEGTTKTSIAKTDFDKVLVNEVLMYYNTSDKQIWVYNPFTGTYVKSTSEYSKYNDTDYSTIDSVRVILGVRGASTSTKFKGHLEISDLKVEFDSLSTNWTQHPGETYAKNYVMDERGFTISSNTNMMFIDEDEIAAYTLNAEGKPEKENPVFQISGEETILKKTIVKTELLIENDTQEKEDAFVMKQYKSDGDGQWYFLFY